MGLIQITIFIPKELEDKAKKAADTKFTSKSQLCREILCRELNRL